VSDKKKTDSKGGGDDGGDLFAAIEPVEIEDQMKSAYLDYAMSVIIGRALPDVRDGLKPVHRRILHAMNERAWRSDRAYVKSAKIVGEVIGNYHPHGDIAVYDTMVRMAQDFVMRMPTIDGQGNFGSIDGDPPAAYRYTEARLNKVAEELLKDIEKETVDLNPNFDDTRREPVVLPSAFPNLLVNGSDGIAVGMATKIPPHNLGEAIDATVALIDNPDLSVKQLMRHLKGPDFPTGAMIMGSDGIYKAYSTGRGSLKIRGTVEIEETKKERESIIITSIPYQVNKSALITRIAELVNDKTIEGISELRDESDRNGMRIYIGLKKDINSSIIINQLYKHTAVQSSFGVILLAIVDGEPKILDLKGLLNHYIVHRKNVITRRTQYDLRKAEERAHILEGLKIALDNIDEVIKIIKASKDAAEAGDKLMKRFALSEIQTKAILDMRLQRLTNLEVKKIVEELKALVKLIDELKAILKSEKKIYEIVKSELLTVREKYADERKTQIIEGGETSTDFDAEDLIADENVVISITNDNFIRRLPIDTYKKQHRGGKGVIGMSIKQEDFVRIMNICSTHDMVFLFSNKGKIFALKAYEIPIASKASRGKSLRGLINLAGEEYITAISSVNNFDGDMYLCMATRNGILKKIDLRDFKNARKGGIMAINLKKDDELAGVNIVEKGDDVVLVSSKGLLLRTSLLKMRSMGRSAAGIIGMRLDKDDRIIGLDVVKKGSSLFIITEGGYGKRVDYRHFAVKGRGGKGMACVKVSEKHGAAIGVRSVFPEDEIVIISKSSMAIRVLAKDISMQGRTATGVRLLNVDEDDIVSDFAVITEE
jgi:DNA gyrase subunit A